MDRNELEYRKSDGFQSEILLPFEKKEKWMRFIKSKGNRDVVVGLAVSLAAVVFAKIVLKLDFVQLFKTASIVDKIKIAIIPIGYGIAFIFGVLYLIWKYKVAMIRKTNINIPDNFEYTVMKVVKVVKEYPYHIIVSNRIRNEYVGDRRVIDTFYRRKRFKLQDYVIVFRRYGSYYALSVNELADEDLSILRCAELMRWLAQSEIEMENEKEPKMRIPKNLSFIGVAALVINAIALLPYSLIKFGVADIVQINKTLKLWILATWVQIATFFLTIEVQVFIMSLFFVLPILELWITKKNLKDLKFNKDKYLFMILAQIGLVFMTF